MSTKSAQYLPPQNEDQLVAAWIRRAREAQSCHYELANIYSARNKWLGMPVIIITTIIGTSVFASLTAEAIGAYEKILVGMLSVVAAVLASLQTFFKYTEQSEKHRTAAARFGTVRRKLEAIYAQRSQSYDHNYLNALREDLDRLAEDSPNVPVSTFDRVQRNIRYTDGSEPAPLQNPAG